MSEVLCHALTCLLQVMLYLISFTLVSFLALAFGLKLWLEPHKGTCRCKVRLDNKVALVTGANTGIGLETARDLARRGARVIIASRNDLRSKQAVADIIATTGNANVEYRHLDLSSLRKIGEFAEDFNKNVDRLDILVNNAGCGGLKAQTTEDGIDMVMQVNYLGPFLLTNLLMDKLEKSKPSRIVIVSSSSHHVSRFDPADIDGLKPKLEILRYTNSKLCNVLWARALSRRLPRGVTVNSLHPGVTETEIFDKMPKIQRFLTMAIVKTVFKTPVEGAQTSIHLCVSPDLEGISGKYFKDCKLGNVSKTGSDDDISETVWNNSVKLIEQRWKK